MFVAKKIFAVLPAVLILASHAAYAEIYTCPPDIKTNQSIKTDIEGWKSYLDTSVNGAHNLAGMSVYDGPPQEMADLVPDNEEKKPGEPVYWTFNKKKERSIWLQCDYRQTTMRLSRELPKDIVKCVARSSNSMECK